MAWRPGPLPGTDGDRPRSRLAHASAKLLGITFPAGTGRAGQHRSGLFAGADTVLADGSAPAGDE